MRDQACHTHPQSGCRNQCLDFVGQQGIFKFFSSVSRSARVCLNIDALRFGPVGHQLSIAYGQGINDAVPLKRCKLFC